MKLAELACLMSFLIIEVGLGHRSLLVIIENVICVHFSYCARYWEYNGVSSPYSQEAGHTV